MRVRNSVAVVTGASSGIGRATALAFAEAGADVVLAARGDEALDEAREECAARGAEAIAVSVEAADETDIFDLRDQAVARFGRIDVWVNAAAVTIYSPFLKAPLVDIRRIIDVNVMGYVYGSRAALEQMRRQESGTLINISSITALTSQPYSHPYVMSKAAERNLSASLRQELRLDDAKGIHVCTVLPASIDTPIYQHAANYTGRKIVPLPPVYPPERVARAVLDLVRVPRREVIVGPAGRALLMLSKLAPGLLERLMAILVDRIQLSRKEPAPISDGNLFQPDPDTDTIDGGWHGRRRTAVRRAATVGALIAAGTLAGRRPRNGRPARRVRAALAPGRGGQERRAAGRPLAGLVGGMARR